MRRETAKISSVMAFCLCFVCAATWPSDLRADDWSVERGDDVQQRVIDRYREMLEANPVEGMALNRLIGHVGRGAGLDRLISQYERRVENSPNAVNLRLVLAHLLKARGDYDEAFAQYDRVVELDPQESLGWLGRGTVRLLSGERREAMEDFEQALERERDRSRRHEILQQLGELSFSQRDFERGREFFDRLLAENQRDQYMRMDYVRLLVQYRQFDEALEQYEVLMRLAGGDTRQRVMLLRDMADVHEMRDDYDEALSNYEQALRLVQSDSGTAREIRQRIVEVHRRAGRLQEFVEEYGQRWLRGASDQQMLVADVYAELGELEEALRLYRRQASQNRSAVTPRRKAIRLLERLGLDNEIPAAYRDLIRADPRNHRFALELAEYHMRSGERDEAKGVLDDLARRLRSQSYVMLEVAEYYRRWNFEDEAESLYELVLRRESDDDAVLVEVGDFFFERGERQRAIEIWQRLPNSHLGRRAGTMRMAELFVERGIMTQGITAFEELLEATPEDERLLRAIARAYERARRWNEAMERWEDLLRVAQTPTRQQEARGRIVELHRRNNTLRAQVRRWQHALGQHEEDSEQAMEAGFFLVESHMRLREFNEAEAVLAEMRQWPDLSTQETAAILLLLEQNYVRTDRYRDAIAVLQELRAVRPDMDRELLERMSDHALEARSAVEAIDFASRALEANPDDARAQARMARVHRRSGDLEEAARHFRTATEINSRAHEVFLELGEVLKELERWSEAEEALMEVVENSREDQLVLDAGELMLAMARQRGRLGPLESQWAPLAFRLPIRPVHGRLMLDLYDQIAGPLLLDVHHGSAQRREQAQQELHDLGGRAASLLVEQLRREQGAQQGRALRMVAEMGVDVAASQIARMIRHGDDERMRKMAIVTAARIGSPLFVEPLEEALTDGAPVMRHLATWALGHIDDERAVNLLVDLVDPSVERNTSALAVLGLRQGRTARSRQVVADRLSQAASLDEREFKLLITAVEYSVMGGEGEEFRELINEMAVERRDQMGTRAAQVLGAFGDAAAAEVLWGLLLSDDVVLARRGEVGMRRLWQAPDVVEPRWIDEVNAFDWTQGSFASDDLLRRVSRRGTGASAADSRQLEGPWPQAMGEGLSQAIESNAAVLNHLPVVLTRLADDLRGARAVPFWDRQGAQLFAATVLDAADDQTVHGDRRLALRILAGETGEVVTRASAGSDDELRVILQALAIRERSDDARGLEPLFLEAMSRGDRATRRQALITMGSILEAQALTEPLRSAIIDAFGDDDSGVRLAAVRASGQLSISSAEAHLAALEVDAPPTLRRAVRQARRALR